MIKAQASILAALAGLDASALTIERAIAKKETESAVLIVGPVEVHLPLAGMVDREAEHSRLRKELADVQAQIDRLEKLLGGDFASKAPQVVVAKERERLAGFKETAEKLRAQLH